jgi:peptidoglycan/xylan/chitin deacetylase (PgdA/CDA1 family)
VAHADASLEVSEGSNSKRAPVAITFDDGFASIADHALPLLAERGFPCTVFVPLGWLGRRPGWESESEDEQAEVVLDRERLRSVASPLVELGAHSLSHPHLTRLPVAEARREISDSRRELEALTGLEVRLFAFPYGDYNDELVQICREAGYQRAYSIRPRPINLRRADFLCGRVAVSAHDGPLEFALKASGAYAWMPLASRIRQKLTFH